MNHDTIMAQGGLFGGWCVYICRSNKKDAVPHFHLLNSETTVKITLSLISAEYCDEFEYGYDGISDNDLKTLYKWLNSPAETIGPIGSNYNNLCTLWNCHNPDNKIDLPHECPDYSDLAVKVSEDFNKIFAIPVSDGLIKFLIGNGYHILHRPSMARRGSTGTRYEVNPYTKYAVDAANIDIPEISLDEFIEMLGKAKDNAQ